MEDFIPHLWRQILLTQTCRGEGMYNELIDGGRLTSILFWKNKIVFIYDFVFNLELNIMSVIKINLYFQYKILYKWFVFIFNSYNLKVLI